jgi:hypothetical protein
MFYGFTMSAPTRRRANNLMARRGYDLIMLKLNQSDRDKNLGLTSGKIRTFLVSINDFASWVDVGGGP